MNCDRPLKIIHSLSVVSLFMLTIFVVLDIYLTPVFLNIWSPIRLAWAFAPSLGYDLYYPPSDGPALLQLYGPLFPFIFSISKIASSPYSALLCASLINFCFYFLPILILGIILFKKNDNIFSPVIISALFLFFTINSSALSYSAFGPHADALALGLTQIAVLLIFFSGNKINFLAILFASLFVTMAFWCKLIFLVGFLGVGFYLWILGQRKESLQFLLCSALWLSLSFIIVNLFFSTSNVFFNIITLLKSHPWKFHSQIYTLLFSMSQFVKESLNYSLIFLIFIASAFKSHPHLNYSEIKEWLTYNHWGFYFLLGLLFLPSSLIHFSTYGGDSNSFSPIHYFWAVALCVFITNTIKNKESFAVRLMTIFLLCAFIIMKLHTLLIIPGSFRTALNNDETAAFHFAQKHPNQAYFPNNPLATIYSDGKIYHTTYGLFIREISGFPVSQDHFRKYIPADLKYVIFPSNSLYQYDYILNTFPTLISRLHCPSCLMRSFLFAPLKLTSKYC